MWERPRGDGGVCGRPVSQDVGSDCRPETAQREDLASKGPGRGRSTDRRVQEALRRESPCLDSSRRAEQRAGLRAEGPGPGPPLSLHVLAVLTPTAKPEHLQTDLPVAKARPSSLDQQTPHGNAPTLCRLNAKLPDSSRPHVNTPYVTALYGSSPLASGLASRLGHKMP